MRDEERVMWLSKEMWFLQDLFFFVLWSFSFLYFQSSFLVYLLLFW